MKLMHNKLKTKERFVDGPEMSQIGCMDTIALFGEFENFTRSDMAIETIRELKR